MGNTSDFKKVIHLIAKNFAKKNVPYSQSQYVFREVRKKLELKPKKKSKGTVKRLSRTEYQNFIHAAYEKSSQTGLMIQTLFETAARVDEFTSLNADDAEINSIEVAPHTLRHTRATFLVEGGMGKDHLQVFLGHDLLGTTQIHTKTVAIDTDREFRKLTES